DVRTPRSKQAELMRLVRERQGKSGIIYCSTRAYTEQVCDALIQKGYPATRYHAGLSDEERRRNQDDFRFDRAPLMVATNAFGMGIDKSNVSYVIHYNMPKSLEAYYQEAGRAGRDGEPADCILLYSGADVVTARFLIDRSGEGLEEEEREQVRLSDLRRLDEMVAYCKSDSCYRTALLRYFGQQAEEGCSNCGNCKELFETVDITREAQMILSCVIRMRDHMGYSVGSGLVTKCLKGSKGERLLRLGLDRLSTYGLMKSTPESRIREWIDRLVRGGYLRLEGEYRTLRVTGKAHAVLFDGEKVEIRTRKTAKPAKEERREERRREQQQEETGLIAVLKRTRAEVAAKEGLPLYLVFSNATLADMVRREPSTMEEFLAVSGVGSYKAERYGETFLQAIRDWIEGGREGEE
ncbi:MAG: HRDC domain-containing protein, partial [Clostridia bacterium]|nr:HRDC domain-containing protein [Clostridia bacterium]